MATTLDSELRLPCGAVLPNRIAKAAMTEGLADKHDHATTAHENLYRTWSRGGCGLLITGNVMIDHRYLERPGNVVVENHDGFDQLKRWAAAGTEGGNHLWVQISHPGRQCARISSGRPLSPSDVQLEILGNFAKPRPMTEDDIQSAICGYARTANIVKQAGFTGVQVHAAHGYLISQFLSPITNLRSDQWGGSLENRTRFLLKIVRAVRDTVGQRFPVSVKLNSADFQKGGFTLEESARVAQWLAQENIDLLEISGGTYEHTRLLGHSGDQTTAEDPDIRESTRQREAYFLDYAKTIQGASKLPLMVTGGFRSRRTMVEALAANELNVIGLGRPLCVESSLPQQLINAEVDEAPTHEKDLKLGSGLLGPASRLSLFRAINVQGEAAWYYRQIIQLSRLQEPLLNIGVLRAFVTHMLRELRIGMRRRWARRGRT